MLKDGSWTEPDWSDQQKGSFIDRLFCGLMEKSFCFFFLLNACSRFVFCDRPLSVCTCFVFHAV